MIALCLFNLWCSAFRYSGVRALSWVIGLKHDMCCVCERLLRGMLKKDTGNRQTDTLGYGFTDDLEAEFGIDYLPLRDEFCMVFSDFEAILYN